MTTVKKSENKSKKETLRESIAPFAAKLYQILHSSQYESDISWNDKGDTILILDVNSLPLNVLSRNFRDPRYPAFAKKLTAHGFQEVSVDDTIIGFMHPHFRKNCKAQLHKVKKIRGTKRGSKRRSKKSLKNKKQAESLDVSSSFKMMAAKANQALSMNNLAESMKLVSEMNSCLQNLESECSQLYSLVNTQAEEITSLEQKIIEYKDNYDTACAEIYTMIVARRNGLKDQKNPLDKKLEKNSIANEDSKIAKEKYKFGLDITNEWSNSEINSGQPTPTSVNVGKKQYDKNITGLRDKLVKKDENAPNMLAVQKKSADVSNLICYNQSDQNVSTILTNDCLSSIYSDVTNEKGEFGIGAFDDFEFNNAKFLEETN